MAIFAIKQVQHFLPYESLRTIYYALIHPHLCYGILAWGNANDSMLFSIKLFYFKKELNDIFIILVIIAILAFQHSGILKLRETA